MRTATESGRSTADQLRHDIDRGRTERRGRHQPQPETGLGHAWILVGFILALFAGMLAWFIATA
jgi:fatty acid desaturase